jgi:hypothetical protein
MHQLQTPTGRKYNILGIEIEEVEVEPCQRLTQLARGEAVTCNCTRCLGDTRQHPRYQFGRHGLKRFIMHDLHEPNPKKVTVAILDTWEESYKMADELNRAHYGGTMYDGWQRKLND